MEEENIEILDKIALERYRKKYEELCSDRKIIVIKLKQIGYKTNGMR